MHDVKAAHRIRGQIERIAGNLSRGLPKVGQRLVREVLYGAQARGSVRLSEIARPLGERTALKKVIGRWIQARQETSRFRWEVRENALGHRAQFLQGHCL